MGLNKSDLQGYQMNNNTLGIVDAYIHCGMQKYEPIEKVREVMQLAGVTRAVLVQHLGEFDNSYIAAIVNRYPQSFAGVCMVDSTSCYAADTLKKLVTTKRFKGVRLVTDSLRTCPQLWEAVTQLDLIIVLYAPTGVVPYLDPLRRFFDKNPECRLVITHMGSPQINDAFNLELYQQLFCLSEYPNVYYQLSGMKMCAPYPYEVLYPFVEEAIERFGSLRVLWGSNFPVVGNNSEYIKELDLLLEGKLPVSQKAIKQIANYTANSLWFPEFCRSKTNSSQ